MMQKDALEFLENKLMMLDMDLDRERFIVYILYFRT